MVEERNQSVEQWKGGVASLMNDEENWRENWGANSALRWRMYLGIMFLGKDGISSWYLMLRWDWNPSHQSYNCH